MLRTSEEERHYRTIHGSALATQIALSHSRAQTNPTVERGPCPMCEYKLGTAPAHCMMRGAIALWSHL